MKKHLLIPAFLVCGFISVFENAAYTQPFCQPSGNVIIFSNYDGGILTINMNMNLPNLKIGIVSYENDSVVFTGQYVSNITKVIYAGFYNSSNVHCPNQPQTKTITGAPTGTDTVIFVPPATYFNPYGYSSIICNISCDNTSSQGGCNTPDQIANYFFQEFGSTVLLFHKTQYGCWTGTQNISSGGNCCIVPPATNIIENAVDNTSIMPNPGNGIFEFSLGNGQFTNVEIYNIHGNIVFRKYNKGAGNSLVEKGKMKIDLSYEPKGIYFYKVFSENNFFTAGKLIIQ